MTFNLKVEVTADSGTSNTHTLELGAIERSDLSAETLGLMLEESKTLLKKLQEVVVRQQINTHLEETRACVECGKKRVLKDDTTATFNTVFGKLKVSNPRWQHCACQTTKAKTFRPLARLLPERTTPELLYLETKWASLASFSVTAGLLKDVLPVDDKLSGVAVRTHLHKIATKADLTLGEERVFFVDGCPREWAELPVPDGPFTVGLDGGFVRSTQKGKFFEVIAGKSILSFKRDSLAPGRESDAGETAENSKCFGFVHTYDDKAKRRVYETLRAQGLQNNQQITFLSDGGESLRGLQHYLSPEAEYVLDWFHVAMRMTVLRQIGKGLPEIIEDNGVGYMGRDDTLAQLESIKHYLWHGNSYRALQMIGSLEDSFYVLVDTTPQPTKAIKNLYTYLADLNTYIKNNAGYIRNYGERYRNGERISTGFVESTINQVVSKRFCKKQQMRWTKRGAHLLLQTRTKVLNDELEDTFRAWYPRFRAGDLEMPRAA
ncbi:MAG: ISKra4 family transposase [Deinococcota bacterium]|nr:ISKra4 family transposase [Deinococcota bacterium]